MFSLVLMVAALSAPQTLAMAAPTTVQPLVRYNVLAPDQATAQKVHQFLSTPGTLSIAFPAPPSGTLNERASYRGAITVAGLSYYAQTIQPGQTAPTPQMYQNKYVVQPAAGVSLDTELYIGRCADALNRGETNQWQLTDFAISRWSSTAPGTLASWTSFARGQIARMKAGGWTYAGESHSYNPVARYSGTSWRYTRSSTGLIRTLYVSLNNSGPVRLMETEYAFSQI
ncbi:MAG TPA: hypothetical protein VII69_09590 [Candidatus Eremiobacteraceae bacterium]